MRQPRTVFERVVDQSHDVSTVLHNEVEDWKRTLGDGPSVNLVNVYDIENDAFTREKRLVLRDIRKLGPNKALSWAQAKESVDAAVAGFERFEGVLKRLCKWLLKECGIVQGEDAQEVTDSFLNGFKPDEARLAGMRENLPLHRRFQSTRARSVPWH